MGIPEWIGYAYLRWFHRRSTNIMANTETMLAELTDHGFRNLTLWGRGVDCERFHPLENKPLISWDGPAKPWPRPYWINVGRVSVEKNLEAFYQLKLPGTMIQVGDGPARESLQRKYPHVRFVGAKGGDELAHYYGLGDCFVFPSLTDTYGVVLLEALASGLPVAAMPSAGPSDIIENHVTGVVDVDLQRAAEEAIKLDPEACRTAALAKSWSAATDEFERHLVNR
jgi:glycosyltransferase involved in cell wall biosynthesis